MGTDSGPDREAGRNWLLWITEDLQLSGMNVHPCPHRLAARRLIAQTAQRRAPPPGQWMSVRWSPSMLGQKGVRRSGCR